MGVTQRLGTIPLAIFTDASNNIGIGGSPSGSYKFEVTGTARVSGVATFSSSVITPSLTNSGQFKMDYGANAASRSWRLVSDSYNFGDFSIQQSTTQTGTTYADKFLISAAGNIGIGTNTPTFPLHIYYPTGSAANALVHIQATTNYSGFYAKNTGGELYFAIDNSTGTGFGNGGYSRLIYSNGAYPLDFYTNDLIRMRITSGGNVLINQTSGATNVSLKIRGVNQTNANYSFLIDNAVTDLFYVRNDGIILTGSAANSPYNYSTTGRTPILNSGGILGYLVSTRESKANIESIKVLNCFGLLNVITYKPTLLVSKVFVILITLSDLDFNSLFFKSSKNLPNKPFDSISK